MLKAKLLAMCVCPAVLAPPTILAVHRPARHAVANLLQRAAHRLDDRVPAAIPAPATLQYANIPCAPTLAEAAGSDVPVISGVGLARLSPADQAIYGDAALPGSGLGGGGFFLGGGGGGGGGGTGGGGGGGGSGPGSSTNPVLTPVSTTPSTPLPSIGGSIGLVPPSVGGTMGSVPEPATWALLVTGFGVVGAGLRYKRVVTA